MTYTLRPHQLASISDVELAFSTERLLPSWDDIPVEFKEGNDYTRLAEAIMFNWELPDLVLKMKEGFEARNLNRAVRAHLQSFGPKHQHKIAGVGYMIACACTLTARG